jgi:RNA polymerase sigma factor (sigma-70 family)
LARTGVDLVASVGEDETLDRVSASTTVRRLAAVLAGLPHRERSVLLLIAWEQFTYEEVAGALDIPVGTVRSRLHHARKRLRAALVDLESDQNREKS